MIDLGTIFLSNSFTILAVALILFLLWFHNRCVASLVWAGGLLAQGAGLLLIVARGQVPRWLSITVGNWLLVLGFFLVLIGLSIFFARKIHRSYCAAFALILVGMPATFYYFTFVDNDLNARIILGSVSMCIEALALAVFIGALPAEQEHRRILVFLRISFFLLACSFGARALIILIFSPEGRFLHATDISAPLILINQVLSVLISIALILLVNERLLLRLKKSHAELTESKELYQAVVENSPSGISVVNPRGRLTYTNPALQRQLGYSQTELNGRHFNEIISTQDRMIVEERFQKRLASATDVPPVYEAEVVTSKGMRRVFEIHSRLLTVGKKVLGVLAQTVDVTQRKEDAQKIEQHTNHLQNLVEERTRELIHAERLSSIGVLASGLAHEINNPNNCIRLNAFALKKGWDALYPHLMDIPLPVQPVAGAVPLGRYVETVPAMLDDITEGSSRIERIIGNMRDLASNKSDTDFVVLDLNEAVGKALSITSKFIADFTTRFTLRLCQTPVAVKGDTYNIEHILLNLVQNSCHALASAQDSIGVTTMKSGSTAQLIVADEGIGISPEHRDKVFDPFFTTRREKGGSGLGLSVVHHLIQEMNGSISIDSAKKKGTTVTIAFPLAAETAVEEEPA
jgi:PAS domain S-box-containing protein